jgi:hypothetical protein
VHLGDQWCQVRINTSGLATLDQFDHWHDLGRQRDVCEANIVAQLANLVLVIGEDVRVRQHNGNTRDAICNNLLQLRFELLLIDRLKNLDPLSRSALHQCIYR